ncbi:cytochrome P450 [Hyaloscypha variabilis F]|uniref:Cytochrome P450 n=1 Tax=Hyaloscypha variabilis (strain UAMH 11265 / GT02V1 / F) TaxID=1149755 RepID=A0A2J6S769_HYAVF|nr:cytochrome P450 [Hyaloscypha variabilis F]
MSSFETLLEFGRSSAVLSPGTIGVVALIILWTLYVLISNPVTIKFLTSLQKQATQTQVPRIPKIPEAPDALPFVGNLMPLGGRLNENDSTIYSQWPKKLSSDIFQIRLGSERAVVANTFSTIKDLWVGHSNDLIDKPQQHGFAEKLEYDLSGANMTEPIRRCRKAATRALGKPLWPTYYHLLEPSSVYLTRELLSKDDEYMDIYPYLRHIVFDLALSLTYGTVSNGVDDEFTDALVESINQISFFRASTQRLRDYIPILRFLIPDFVSGNLVVAAEKRRQKYLDVIFDALKKRIASGEQLSTPIGQGFQSELYDAILAAYSRNRDKAWEMAFREESVELLVSLYKETLRFWTITPYSLPRTTFKDISYYNTVIPKGTTMIMNAQQANHDTAWYGDDALQFRPTRFMGKTDSLPHLTFGAGSRICPAAALSNRIIYALIARLVLAFKINEPKDPRARKANADMLDFSAEYKSLVALPRRFDVSFSPRDEGWIRTKLL